MFSKLLFGFAVFLIFHFTAHSQWTSIGPYGGQVDAMIAINDTIFAASNNGIFKSINNGDLWERESDGMPSLFTVKKFLYIDSLLCAGNDKGLFLYSFTSSNWGDKAMLPMPILDFTSVKQEKNNILFAPDGKLIYASEIRSNIWTPF